MVVKDIAEKWMRAEEQAFQEGKFDALEQLESPDIVIHMPPLPEVKGFEAHKQYITSAVDTISNLTQEWDYITGDGNVCVISFKETMTMKVDNPLIQVKAGTDVVVDAFFVLRLENEKITEIWIKSSITTS